LNRDNYFYGHNLILALYADFARALPIWGYLQHGWMKGTGFASVDHHRAGWKRFVWSQDNLQRAQSECLDRVHQIGAPFCYLVKMTDSVHAPLGRGTIVYPFHGWEGAEVSGDHQAYAHEIRSTESLAQGVTVCLHPADFRRPALRKIYVDAGFQVETNGDRFSPGFMIRQHAQILKHARVVSNRPTTALWYGGLLRRNIQTYGPHFLLATENSAAKDPESRELSRGLTGPDAQGESQHQLGWEAVLGPAALADILGWAGPRRYGGPLLGALASTRRIINDRKRNWYADEKA
jgi:hypothetical protein